MSDPSPTSTNYFKSIDDLINIFESYPDLVTSTFSTNYLLEYNSSFVDLSEIFISYTTFLSTTDSPVNYTTFFTDLGTLDLSQVFVPKTFNVSNKVNINITNHSVGNYIIYSFSAQTQVGSSNVWVDSYCTLTFPNDITLNLIVVGGGGGGGFAQDNYSGGGGAGGSIIQTNNIQINAGDVDVQVGSGGSLYINGYQNGQKSYFGTYVTASGGAQGQNATTSSNGTGGQAVNNGAGGDSGDNGTNGNEVNINNANVYTFSTGGGGGGGVESNSSSAFYGGGNGAVSTTGGTAGVTNEYPTSATGKGYGAGGGGGGGIPGDGVAGGGAGSAGIVVLWYTT